MRTKCGTHCAVARIALLAVLLLCALPAIAGAQAAQPSCDTSQETEQLIGQTWQPTFTIALAAVFVAFAIATIILMVGIAIKSDRVRNFGVGELYEAVATAIMVGFFLFVTGLEVNAIPSTVIGLTNSLPSTNSLQVAAAGTNPYVYTISGVCNTIGQLQTIYDTVLNDPSGADCPSAAWLGGASECGYKNQAQALSVDYSITTFSKYTNLVLNLLPAGTGTAKLDFFDANSAPSIALAPALVDLMSILWAEYYLMVFFSYMGPVLMAVGVVFRALLPTRSLGGVMMAAGMGFYIVMPTLFSFAFAQCTPGTINPGNGVTCPIQKPAGLPFSPIISSYLTPLWMLVLFYPVLVISMTYAFITQVANFIGASAQMGGKLRAGFI